MWTPDAVKDLISYTIRTLCVAYVIMVILLAFARSMMSDDD